MILVVVKEICVSSDTRSVKWARIDGEVQLNLMRWNLSSFRLLLIIIILDPPELWFDLRSVDTGPVWQMQHVRVTKLNPFTGVTDYGQCADNARNLNFSGAKDKRTNDGFTKRSKKKALEIGMGREPIQIQIKCRL